MNNPDRPAEPWMVNHMQRSVANDICCKDMPYDTVLGIFQKWKLFENWTVWEMDNRPVDVDEIREMVEQEIIT